MKRLKLCISALVVFSIPMPASTILGAGPFGVLTDAKILVPVITSGGYFDGAHSSFNQSYTVLVTGGSGSGLLNFTGDLYATDVEAVLGYTEGVSADSTVSRPFFRTAQTPPANTICDFVCNVQFTYGVPESFTFIADSFVGYSVMVDSVDKQYWHFPVEASIDITGVQVLDPKNFNINSSAIIQFSQVPEPRTFFLCLGLIAIIVFGRPRTNL